MDENSPLLSIQVDVNSEDVDCLSVPSLSKEDRDGKCDKTTSYSPLNANQTSFVPRRKPFHYDSFRRPIQNSRDMHTAAKFHRYKYISKLSGHNLIIPHHMLPSHLFLIVPKKSGEKQNSLVTIFSVWNTMMGTSLLSIPWAISQAGFALGMILLIFMAGICLYTCYLILKCAEEQMKKSGEILEFSDICKKYLGKPGELLAILFSLAAIVGAAIVYWVLMSNFLYNSGKYIYDSIHHEYSIPANFSVLNSTVSPTHLEVLCPASHSRTATASTNNVIKDDANVFFKIWRCQYSVPFFLIIVLFPLCSVKSPTFFTKFNSLGTLSALYLFVFSITKATIWGIHLDFHGQSAVPEFKEHFPALTGILTLAYFIHNCVLSITRNQEHPENNVRDLSIAFSLVAMSYVVVGVVFYMVFPADKSCIQQVFLDNLPSSDVMTFVARLFLLFQLMTVFPLIVYIIRVQFMLYLFDKTYPGFFHVFILNLTLVGTCVLFAVVYPHVGNIIRYVGSLSGLAYNYSLPCIVFMMIQRQRGTLSWPSAIFHSSIIVLGVLNFVSQFLIRA